MGKRVTIPQAVEITGLKEYTIRKGIREGRYPYIRTGIGSGKILIDIELFEQYLRQEAVDNACHALPVPEAINYGKLRVINE